LSVNDDIDSLDNIGDSAIENAEVNKTSSNPNNEAPVDEEQKKVEVVKVDLESDDDLSIGNYHLYNFIVYIYYY